MITRKKTASALTALLVAASLAACGTSSDDDSAGTPRSDSASRDQKPTVEVVAYGFGQRDQYVQGIAIATSDDVAAVGEFVTVSMNFMDEAGTILATEEQVESFAWVGQQLVLPVWLDLSSTDPKAVVAKVEVSATLSSYGSSEAPRPELPPSEGTIGENMYGGATATFELTNDGAGDLEDLRVGVVCYDADQKIIGGSSEYPSLVAAGQTIRLDADVVTSGIPASCTAYPNYGV